MSQAIALYKKEFDHSRKPLVFNNQQIKTVLLVELLDIHLVTDQTSTIISIMFAG